MDIGTAAATHMRPVARARRRTNPLSSPSRSDMTIDAVASRNFQTTIRPALQKYHDAARLDPSSARFRYDLGRLLLVQDRLDDAVDCLRAAVGRGSFEARFMLGIALGKLAAETADKDYSEQHGSVSAHMISEAVQYLREGLDVLVYKSSWEQPGATRQLLSTDSLRCSNPMVLDGLVMLATMLMWSGRHAECIEACRDAVPEVVNALQQLHVLSSPTAKHSELVLFELHRLHATAVAHSGDRRAAATYASQAAAMIKSAQIRDAPQALEAAEVLAAISARCCPTANSILEVARAQQAQYEQSPVFQRSKPKLLAAGLSFRAVAEMMALSSGPRPAVPKVWPDAAPELRLLRAQRWWSTLESHCMPHQGGRTIPDSATPASEWASVSFESALELASSTACHRVADPSATRDRKGKTEMAGTKGRKSQRGDATRRLRLPTSTGSARTTTDVVKLPSLNSSSMAGSHRVKAKPRPAGRGKGFVSIPRAARPKAASSKALTRNTSLQSHVPVEPLAQITEGVKELGKRLKYDDDPSGLIGIAQVSVWCCC